MLLLHAKRVFYSLYITITNNKTNLGDGSDRSFLKETTAISSRSEKVSLAHK